MTAARLAAMASALLCLCAAPADAAYPTPVNSQITDAITQTNVKVLGEAPAMAMGQLFTTTAGAVTIANATNPESSADLDQATTMQSVQTLYAVDTASDPAEVAWMLRTACSTYLTAQLYAWCAARAAG